VQTTTAKEGPFDKKIVTYQKVTALSKEELTKRDILTSEIVILLPNLCDQTPNPII